MFLLEIDSSSLSETKDDIPRYITDLLKETSSKNLHFEDSSDFLVWAEESLFLTLRNIFLDFKKFQKAIDYFQVNLNLLTFLGVEHSEQHEMVKSKILNRMVRIF
jgi:hypothetical protein